MFLDQLFQEDNTHTDTYYSVLIATASFLVDAITKKHTHPELKTETYYHSTHLSLHVEREEWRKELMDIYVFADIHWTHKQVLAVGF